MKASVEHVREKYAFTERRACRLLLVPASSFRYQPQRRDDDLRERLIELARKQSRYGYRRLHVLLARDGERVNHKRVHRIYREAGLVLRRKPRKHCVRAAAPLGSYTEANQEWALDFVHDATASGRSIRVLNVVDAYTRESLAMEVDTSFAGLSVTRALDQIIAERGLPQAIRCDKPGGPRNLFLGVERVVTSSRGISNARSTSSTRSLASPRRMATWKASTVNCARNVCAPAGSKISSTPAARSAHGGRSITNNGRTARSAT
jgi:transposase InsO family protein